MKTYSWPFTAINPSIRPSSDLGPLRDRNYRFPYPFIYLVKSLPFHIPESPEALRSFWVELLRMGRYIKPGGALGYFLGGYVPPGTPNWHPVLKKISPKIDTPF